MDPSPLCAAGHVALYRDLVLAGGTRREIDALARHPLVIRPRKGLYLCAHLSESERITAEVGARLDCVTVLARHKIWVGHTQGLHLRMPKTAGTAAVGRLRTVQRQLASAGYRLLGSRRIRAHWLACSPPEPGARLEVPVTDALRQAMYCLPPDDLVAALESALHLEEITAGELDALIVAAPRRLQRVLAEVTPGAQSGYETKARLKLQRAGHHVETQVPVPGVGHEDTVIDGAVVLDIDGEATHAGTFESDRDRDMGAEAWGLRSLRIPAVWVDTRWDEVLGTLERMIADATRAQRWPPAE